MTSLFLIFMFILLIPLLGVGCAKAESDYKWLSSDISTVSVSASGTIQGKKPGKATIKVVSVYDSLNYDEVILLTSVKYTMFGYKPKSSAVNLHLFLFYLVCYLNSRGSNMACAKHIGLAYTSCSYYSKLCFTSTLRAFFVSSSPFASFLSKWYLYVGSYLATSEKLLHYSKKN